MENNLGKVDRGEDGGGGKERAEMVPSGFGAVVGKK